MLNVMNRRKIMNHNDTHIEPYKEIVRVTEKCDMSQWISVKDRMPEREQKIIFTDGNIVEYGALDKIYYYKKECRFYIAELWNENNYILDNVTHWMPLPEPPK